MGLLIFDCMYTQSVTMIIQARTALPKDQKRRFGGTFPRSEPRAGQITH